MSDELEQAVMDYAERLDKVEMSDLTEALNVMILFFQAKGLRVNFSLVVASHTGVASVGNLPPDMQHAVFNTLAERIEENKDGIRDSINAAKAKRNAPH